MRVQGRASPATQTENAGAERTTPGDIRWVPGLPDIDRSESRKRQPPRAGWTSESNARAGPKKRPRKKVADPRDLGASVSEPYKTDRCQLVNIRVIGVQKKYIVQLTAQERWVCQKTVRKDNGSSEKARRAQILLKADRNGPAWTDRHIADFIPCRTKTVENIRQRCVLEGFEKALERKRRESPPVPKLLNGDQEARIIALHRGPPPKDSRAWSLRLLARTVVELKIVESVSHETIRRTLKKRDDPAKKSSTG